jgi:hypothetical protein
MPRSVPALLDAWLLAGRLQRKLGRGPARLPPYREIFCPYVRDASFVDVGTMWSVDGRYAFEAEEEGAASVTAFDGMAPTPEFERERERRASAVRFVQGDINDPAAVEAIGPHDAVWCSGVVYHSPDPQLTVRNLCALADRHVFVGSSTLPELPGLRNACVFLPGLSPADRRSYARVHHLALGLGWPFDPDQWYGNWWGITPSALRSMVEADGRFEVVETVEVPFMAVVVARRIAPR